MESQPFKVVRNPFIKFYKPFRRRCWMLLVCRHSVIFPITLPMSGWGWKVRHLYDTAITWHYSHGVIIPPHPPHPLPHPPPTKPFLAQLGQDTPAQPKYIYTRSGGLLRCALRSWPFYLKCVLIWKATRKRRRSLLENHSFQEALVP